MSQDLTDGDHLAINLISKALPELIVATAVAKGAPHANGVAFVQTVLIETLGATIAKHVDKALWPEIVELLRQQLLEIIEEFEADTVGAPQGSA